MAMPELQTNQNVIEQRCYQVLAAWLNRVEEVLSTHLLRNTNDLRAFLAIVDKVVLILRTVLPATERKKNDLYDLLEKLEHEEFAAEAET